MPSFKSSAWMALCRVWPGLAVSIVIALAASFVSATYGGPQLMYALFFGIAFHFLSVDDKCRPGIEFCSKSVLRIGVALLGARITFGKIGTLGLVPLVIVGAAVCSTILFGWMLSRLFKRPVAEGMVSGGAVAICGASAALAISAVLPQSRENEQFTLFTVIGVTSLSTIAMVVYPLISGMSGLDDTQAGIFIGGTIHDVAQVVGAGYLISDQAGDVATFVKLSRVACLVPAVVALTIIFRTHEGKTEFDNQPLVPHFLVGFTWLLVANSLGFVPPAGAEALNAASRACLVAAISALGVKTSLQALAAVGWHVVVMLVAETLWIAALVLGMLKLSAQFGS